MFFLTVHLLETVDGPVLSYVMEVDDLAKVESAFARSTLPIGVEHRNVLREVLDGPAPAELLLDMSNPLSPGRAGTSSFSSRTWQISQLASRTHGASERAPL